MAMFEDPSGAVLLAHVVPVDVEGRQQRNSDDVPAHATSSGGISTIRNLYRVTLDLREDSGKTFRLGSETFGLREIDHS